MIDPKVSVITVTYNSRELINEYLKAVRQAIIDPSQIILVDNNSRDNTFELLENEKDITFIRLPENVGFGTGCNIGAKQAIGEYLLLLNPDTKLTPKGFDRMLQYLADNPDIGILAPKLIHPNGSPQPSITHLPTLRRAIAEYWRGRKHAYREYAETTNSPIEVEAAYAAAWLMKRSVFEHLGGFDERFFLYYEDLDMCRRIHKNGLKVVYYPLYSVIHEMGASSRTVKVGNLPPILRTIAHFIPLKNTGSSYYLLRGGNIYFGLIRAFLIRMVIFTGNKFRFQSTKSK